MPCLYCQTREAEVDRECAVCAESDTVTTVHLCNDCDTGEDSGAAPQMVVACPGPLCQDHLWRCDEHHLIKCKKHGEESGCAECQPDESAAGQARRVVEGVSKSSAQSTVVGDCPPEAAPGGAGAGPVSARRPSSESESSQSSEDDGAPGQANQAAARDPGEEEEEEDAGVAPADAMAELDLSGQYAPNEARPAQIQPISPRAAFFHRLAWPAGTTVTIVNNTATKKRVRITKTSWDDQDSHTVVTKTIGAGKEHKVEAKGREPWISDIECEAFSEWCRMKSFAAGKLGPINETLPSAERARSAKIEIVDLAAQVPWLKQQWYTPPEAVEEGLDAGNDDVTEAYLQDQVGDPVKLALRSWNHNRPALCYGDRTDQLPTQVPRLIHRVYIGNPVAYDPDNPDQALRPKVEGIIRSGQVNPGFTQIIWVDSRAWQRQGVPNAKLATMAKWCRRNGILMADAAAEFNLPAVPAGGDRSPRETYELLHRGHQAGPEGMRLAPEYDFAWSQVDKGWALAADVLRIEILKRFGGFYVDFNMVSDVPLDVFCHYGFACGLLEASLQNVYPNNDIMISTPGHPVLTQMQELILERFKPLIVDSLRTKKQLLAATERYRWCTRKRLDPLPADRAGSKTGGQRTAVMRGTGPRVLADALVDTFPTLLDATGPAPFRGNDSLYVMTAKERNRSNMGGVARGGSFASFWMTVGGSSWQVGGDCGCQEDCPARELREPATTE